jgi:hypothetical protein
VETLKGGHASVFGGADSEHRWLPENRTSRPRRVVKDDIVVPRRLIKYWRQRCCAASTDRGERSRSPSTAREPERANDRYLWMP